MIRHITQLSLGLVLGVGAGFALIGFMRFVVGPLCGLSP